MDTLSFSVRGRYALFTDPYSKIGGNKSSYPVPTYEALKGVMKSVYWKPTIIWVVKRVRILSPIRMESKGVKPLKMAEGGNTLAYYTYLVAPAYQVEVQFIWNLYSGERYQADRNECKHYAMAKAMIRKGGRRDVFLGTRECQASVEPCVFGEGKGAYDNSGDRNFEVMFHSFIYPNETGLEGFFTCFWKPIMRNGVIEFIRPDECKEMRRKIRPMKAPELKTAAPEREAEAL